MAKQPDYNPPDHMANLVKALVAVGLCVLGFMVAPSLIFVLAIQFNHCAFQTDCPGGWPSPPPETSISHTMSSSVILDAEHPVAVQEFRVSAALSSPQGYMSGDVQANSQGRAVRVNMFDLSGANVPGSWRTTPAGAIDFSRWEWTQGNLLPATYVVLLELTGPVPGESASVNLTIQMEAAYPGDASALPTGIGFALVPVGPMATRPASILRTTYRETIGLVGRDSERTLQLTLTGAALPVAAGGAGYLVLEARPEEYDGSTAASHLDARVWIDTNEFIDGYRSGMTSGPYWGVAVDPAPGCRAVGQTCDQTLTVVLNASETTDFGAPTPPPVFPSLVFDIEVVDYMLDTPSLPSGATAALTLASGPLYPTSRP